MDENKSYKLKEIVNKISRGECLSCGKNIDKSFNYAYRWRLPLCKKCRILMLKND